MSGSPRDRAATASSRRLVGLVLGVGVYGSVVLILVGFLLTAFPATGKTGLALAQGGVLLLISTPVLRVTVCVAAFVRERDWTYVAITAAVLAMLALSVLAPRLLGR